MKKVTKNLCRVVLSIAAAITLFSGAKSVAQAANDEVVIDFSQGQVYSMSVDDLEAESRNARNDSKFLSSTYKKLWFTNIYMHYQDDTLSNGYSSSEKLFLQLCKNPYQTLFYSESDEKTTNPQTVSVDAGVSTGTYEALFVEGKGSSRCNCVISLAEQVYGIDAKNAEGKRYVKVKFIFKRPNSGFVYKDENGNVSTMIPDAAFTEGDYSYSVTAEGEEVALTALANTGLKNVVIPDSVVHQGITYKVTSVADKAVFNNKNVKSVTIGQNVKTIGTYAFAKCKKLKKFQINSTQVTKIGSKALAKTSKKLVIRVPKAQAKQYKKLLKKALTASAKLKKF